MGKFDTERITIRLRKKDWESLQKLSAKTHKPVSEIARNYILEGMSLERNKEDIDFIRKNIKEEIHIAMDGYMTRLIKLLIKIGTMTITMCFFTSKLLYILLARYKDKLDYDTMLNQAKKQSAAYLGIKDSSIDDLCDTILNPNRPEDKA